MKITLSLILLLSLAVSCASKKAAHHNVEEKVSQETVIDGQALGAKIREMINSSQTLDADKKAKLNALITDVGGKNKKLTEESFKLRSVLVKELISGNVNRKEVKILKKKIKDVEAEKLKNSLATIDKFSAIVSGDPEKEKMMQEMIQIDRVHR
ncbi:MAG: hypothetical protein NDI69_13405 [Bacteriovoracaceae bacterium]|nr:hypothetical protein [Bacteriovoracaceae bacterium]